MSELQATLVNGGERYVVSGRLFIKGKTQDVTADMATTLADETVLDKRGNLVRRFRVTGGGPELVRAAPVVQAEPDPNPDLIVKTASELESEQVSAPDERNRGDMRLSDLD